MVGTIQNGTLGLYGSITRHEENPLTMKRLSALAAVAATLCLSALPALARTGYVIDNASLLSAQTVSAINARVSSFNAQTGKEVVVQTVSSLGGASIRDAAGKAFSDLGVNGVLIYIAKDDRKDFIVPDAAGTRAGWFGPSIFSPIYQSMGAQFKNGDYDGGVTTGVDSVLGIYRSHMSSLGGANGAAAPVRTSANAPYASSPTGGFHLSGFWLIVLLVVAFLVIRSIIRAMSTPRMPMGYGGPPVAPGAPGYGQQGYGPGYGGMGGGGSFFSGMLGGLGGAFLGNELFGGRGGGGGNGGDSGGTWGGGGAAPDAGGWSSDAGQGDTGGGGGGGDWSGGGFGDGGGGGGDSGGGW